MIVPSGAADLASLTSPFTATTSGRFSPFSGCGSSTGSTYKFYVVLQPNQTLSVHQTTNSFDSQHSIFWSESADPTSYPSGDSGVTSGSHCVDDPDTAEATLTNFGSSARKAWFVVI